MKNKIFYWLTILIISILSFLNACDNQSENEGTIEGIITDSQTSQTIEGANVTITPANSSATTGSDGKYQFADLLEGDYTINVSKTGYGDNSKAVTVLGGQVRKGDVALDPIVPILEVNMISLDFGTTYTVLPIEITNVGSNSLDWEISENVAWLSINPISGSTTTETDAIEITIDRNQMGSGQYSQVFSITSNGGNETITVNVEVAADNVPSVTCNQPTNITQTSADIVGSITSIGNSTVIERGHCWSISSNPTTSDNKTTLGGTTSAGQFVSNLTALEPDQVYYVRAYATNSIGTGYSNQITLTTSSSSSVVVTNGLVAYYTFDNQNINDWTGNFNGVNVGVEFSNDIPNDIGFCASFNGSSYINVSNTIIPPASNWSLNIWLKTVNSNQVLYATSVSYCKIYINSSSKLYQYVSSSNYWESTNPISNNLDNQWHMLTITFDGSSAKYYFDAVLNETKSSTTFKWQTYNNTYIGDDPADQTFNNMPAYNGKMDNIRTYNRALSQSEITQIYNLQQ